MECLSFCIANSIDITRLDNFFETKSDEYISIKTRDTVKITSSTEENKVIFIFKNGTVVSWGVKRYQINALLNDIKPFAVKPIAFAVHDEFSYQIGYKTAIQPHDFFDVDCITLEFDNDEIKLSLSYGFSQSVKLQYFETVLEALIEKYTPLFQRLSHTGQMHISRQQLRRAIGEILGAISEMNLISNFLYHPKYFWQHPTLEEHFIMLERYLHIQRRVNAINHRLDTLNEIFAMFNGYLEYRHSLRLEIIIVLLITTEILINVVKFHI